MTHWNSTYIFALKYRTAIDRVTGDKSLKLRRYELDNEDWVGNGRGFHTLQGLRVRVPGGQGGGPVVWTLIPLYP